MIKKGLFHCFNASLKEVITAPATIIRLWKIAESMTVHDEDATGVKIFRMRPMVSFLRLTSSFRTPEGDRFPFKFRNNPKRMRPSQWL